MTCQKILNDENKDHGKEHGNYDVTTGVVIIIATITLLTTLITILGPPRLQTGPRCVCEHSLEEAFWLISPLNPKP